VVLRHFYGYDYAEIASFLGTNPGNIGSLLSRAHADLRRLLAAESPAAKADVQPHASRVAGGSGSARDRID
jgi:hypothetical protein